MSVSFECNNNSCGNRVSKKGNYCGYECKIEDLESQLQEANTEIRDLNDMLVALREETDAELAEARELLLKVQDSMSNLSTHSHEGWAIACADDTFNMIEQYIDILELKEKGDE